MLIPSEKVDSVLGLVNMLDQIGAANITGLQVQFVRNGAVMFWEKDYEYTNPRIMRNLSQEKPPVR